MKRKSQGLLGVVASCAVLIVATLPVTGCSGSAVAQNIVNWTPALQSAVATVDSTAALLAPADAPILIAATAGFDAASDELVAQAKAYLANPSANVLSQLQTAIVTFQQTVNSSLLNVAKITSPAGQQHALLAIQGVATIVTTILGLVQSISSKTAVARMASESPLKLATVRPYMDKRQMQAVASSYGTTVDGFYAQEARAGF